VPSAGGVVFRAPPVQRRARLAGYNAHVDAVLVERLDAALPQTQCTRCGYPACRPYAEAIARGDADINRCPPGGPATIVTLATLAGRSPKPLDAARGTHGPLAVAIIDESRCIGCTLCIDACPVDAILGAAKRMHAVVPSLCSGCELCLAPCPVDCIRMIDAGRDWTTADASAARDRHRARQRRLARGERIEQRGVVAPPIDAARQRRRAVAEALDRARTRRAATNPRSK
jgi:electron transport complex protein RnfB